MRHFYTLLGFEPLGFMFVGSSSAPKWPQTRFLRKAKAAIPTTVPVSCIPWDIRQSLDPTTREELRRGGSTKASSSLLWFSPWIPWETSCKSLFLLLTLLPSCHVCLASSPWIKNNSKWAKPHLFYVECCWSSRASCWSHEDVRDRKKISFTFYLYRSAREGTLSLLGLGALLQQWCRRKENEMKTYWTKFIRFLTEEIKSCFLALF